MPQALVCPKCSAPLQYPADGGPSTQCPYCRTTVLLDQPEMGAVSSQIPRDLRPVIEQVLQMAQSSGHSGPLNKITAIKYYRQATGVGLAEAKRAIESAGPLNVGPPPFGQGSMSRTLPAGGVNKRALAIILSIIVMVFGLEVGKYAIIRNRKTPPINSQPIFGPSARASTPPAAPAFATMVMEFGSQGVGPGHFDDARSIAVDNQGHIYVGEYSNGRVQVFYANGKYLSEFSLGPGSYLQNLIADRGGTVYAVSSSHIYRFTGTTGAPQREMDNDSSRMDYSDACLAPGGVMYALSSRAGDEPEIVKIDIASNHVVSSSDTKKTVGESLDLFRIAALATGEIYALDREKGVFKFAADGRYINRFGGGKAPGASPLDMPPSQLFSPQNIAIDGQGRVYVSDAGSCIKVYDKDGTYLDKFGGSEVAFGIAIDDQDNIYACLRNRHVVRKYAIAKH